MIGSMMFSRSLTWWVEITIVESSEVYFIIALRNCVFEGMSRPFVGSSMNMYLQPQANAKEI